VVVPFGSEGRQLINELCAAFDVGKQYELLRRAQQFTVNVFPYVLQVLSAAQAVRPVQEEAGVLYLDAQYYSDEFGIVTEKVSGMELLDA
jgi:CRISPR-associated endonuclease/helicase Cas3